VIQFTAGSKEFLWVNPELAGKAPTQTGLASDGAWLNYGGDKLWPAPQGWDRPEQWPGPPDAVLDGQPYRCEALPAKSGEAALRLESRPDPRSGIQFSRVIHLYENTTRVRVEATMKNIDSRPRRWGIWAHTQLDASDGKQPNRRMRAWCPVNPLGRSLRGYQVIFGAKDNASFHTDWRRGVVEVDYRYQVGKIGVDSTAGWLATVDGRDGAVFVQRFKFQPNRPYPDQSTVEFWHNGVGKIHAFGRDIDLTNNVAGNPCVFESEALSPFAELQPGNAYSWEYEWLAANIGGDYPVLDCTEAGIVAEPLKAKPATTASKNRCRFTGRFGVFAPGKPSIQFLDGAGAVLERVVLQDVSPFAPLVLNRMLTVPAGAVAAELVISPQAAQSPVRLAQASLRTALVAGQWSEDKAWEWYGRRPWLAGCNYLPSTVVNDIEMWQKGTFDPATIDRELGWAEKLGFNTVRVFLNYVVWKADPSGLKDRFTQFLKLVDRHHLSVMPILFDDCNFAGRIAAPGPQPAPVPGVHNSQWVSSPPLAMVTNTGVWTDLECYAKDMVNTFGRDRRIVVWDLYNEPGNSSMDEKSLPLMEAAFRWARDVKPRQPLTSGAWADLSSPMSRRIMSLSDVVSFHGYDTLPELQKKLEICRSLGRPVLCTEWLHRQSGNTIESIFPVFAEQNIGCWNWGLVYGRTQTYMPWGSKPGDPAPALWQHDLLHPDGTPFRQPELDLIHQLINQSKRRANSRASLLK
jgi:hypothetical protein